MHKDHSLNREGYYRYWHGLDKALSDESDFIHDKLATSHIKWFHKPKKTFRRRRRTYQWWQTAGNSADAENDNMDADDEYYDGTYDNGYY